MCIICDSLNEGKMSAEDAEKMLDRLILGGGIPVEHTKMLRERK